MNTLRLTLNPLEKKSHINPEIYGNFSEHLGRCIYDGIYVGENSDIPNTEGFRTDVVDAFRQKKDAISATRCHFSPFPTISVKALTQCGVSTPEIDEYSNRGISRDDQ